MTIATVQSPVKRMSLSAQKALDFYIGESQTLLEVGSNSQVKALRVAAQNRLKTLGWPTRRDEAWQYTPLTAFLQTPFSVLGATPLTRADIQPFLPEFEAYRMVFVDGYFDEALSDDFTGFEHGLVIETTADRFEMNEADLLAQFHLQDAPAFVALNAMLVQSGLQIEVAPNHVIQKPVFLLHVQTKPNHVACLRHAVKMDAFAELTLIQSQVSLVEEAVHSNWVMDVSVGKGASFEQVILQNETTQSFAFSHQFIEQAQDSQFKTLYVGLGGQVARHQNEVVLKGENAHTSQNSIVFARGQQVIDSRTDLTHAVPHCQTEQLHKFVLDDKAKGVFDGMIKVVRDAQKTDAKMDNKNLLLSDTAKVDVKPKLEIYADDVKCSHGSASGQMDKDQLFYLQARGIRKEEARQMMIEAFLLEPLELVSVLSHRQWLASEIKQKLSRSEKE